MVDTDTVARASSSTCSFPACVTLSTLTQTTAGRRSNAPCPWTFPSAAMPGQNLV